MSETSVYQNVLFIGPDYENPQGGIGAVLYLYAKKIVHFKFLATYNGKKSGIREVIFFFRSFFKIVWKLFIDGNIRIVHIHGASRGSFYRKYIVFLCAKVMGKKTIYHIHGGGFYDFYKGAGVLLQGMITRLINHSDGVICLSESWYRIYETHFLPKRLDVLPNFVEIPSVNPVKEGKVIFLFLGKIMQPKGIYDLLEVIVRLKASYCDDFELWIGGNGETEKLESLIQQYHIKNQVRFLGWVDEERKEAVLQQAHVYVLPSYKEAMPLSILEAMAYGMPVIASDAGGIPEVVEHGHSGYLIRSGDTEALYDAMAGFLRDKTSVISMGHRSRIIVEEKFSVAAGLNKLQDIYEHLLNSKTDRL